MPSRAVKADRTRAASVNPACSTRTFEDEGPTAKSTADGRDVHVVDAVKQLRVAPELVERLHTTWARLRGLLVISAEGRAAINSKMRGWDDGSLKTEADVLAFLKKWMFDESFRHCSECRTEIATVCRVCAKRWGLAAARDHMAAERARKL